VIGVAHERDHRGLSRALNAVTRILGTAAERSSSPSDDDRSAIVDCAVYVRGHRRPGNWHYADALALARRTPHAFVWLGLHEPTEIELTDIAARFELHALPVEDAIQGFQRPKIERYPAMTFAALRTTRYVEHGELTETSEVVETGHVMLFLGRDFVITVRHGVPTELGSLRAVQVRVDDACSRATGVARSSASTSSSVSWWSSSGRYCRCSAR
jgi:magnesium transporter